MQFRRVPSLPPYVFAVTEQLKLELRRAGEDVVDLGFGNPDLPSPTAAVEKLTEAAAKPRNHRYSASRGIPKLRAAICDLYADRFGVELDPETQAVATIGAKEGLAHLMWVLVEPGDAAVVPTPATRSTCRRRSLAGATVVHGGARRRRGRALRPLRRSMFQRAGHPAGDRRLVPAQPDDTRGRDLCSARLVELAREHEALLVHDFAYADISFDGYRPPSVLQVPGAEDVAVEIYSLTKSFSMAGWRVGFALGNAPALAALARLKSYLDYGTFQPIQIASIVALNEARHYSAEVCEIYRSRRDALCGGLARIGWQVEPPRGTMFVWAPIPEPYRESGSLEFALRLLREARVSVSPGVGFGAGGEGHVRFALVENEQRIRQAVRGIRQALPELAAQGA